VSGALVLLLVGCARGPKLPGDALRVPLVRQETDYSCGDAALLSVLRYFGVEVANEQALYDPLETTEQMGTDPEPIASYAVTRGLGVESHTGWTVPQLRASLQAGRPTIVDLQAWRDDEREWATDWDDGHYVVLIGLDDRTAYVMDPSSEDAYAWLPIDELERRWHDVEGRGPAMHYIERLALAFSGKMPHPAASAPLVRLE
jgi:predicted double-glycine peptidase